MLLQIIQIPKMIMGYTMDLVSPFGTGKYNVSIDVLQYQGQPKRLGRPCHQKGARIGLSSCWLTLDESRSCFKKYIMLTIFLRILCYD